MKICTKCKESKELSNFSKRSAIKIGLTAWCKKCCSIDRKNRYDSLTTFEKEKLNEEARIRKALRSESENAIIRKQNSERSRKRYATDINYRLRLILRVRLNAALKNNQKTGSAVDDLGCSIKEFKKYLESKFEPWMTWDNQGNYDVNRKTWQLDHIRALANFNLESKEELLKVCHYSNYQPLLAKENLEKSNKLLF